jgi:hypothetical protein
VHGASLGSHRTGQPRDGTAIEVERIRPAYHGSWLAGRRSSYG